MAARIGVRNGSVYLDRQTVDTYFQGVDAVVILIREGQLQILPVRQMASGGCLLKVRNAAGDRVANAPDVFSEHGLSDWQDEGLAAQWSSSMGALVADLTAN